MADSDLLSSPDPLLDEVPSSARPYTRRIMKTLPQSDLSTFSLPRSTPRLRSPTRGTSPRKRTFELDVGNEHSPQRILVTVEAEEALRRGTGRHLFQPSSPTRSPRRRDANTTTTTTVPLNDENGGEATPRRRGRPRRTSNGTPMPRGRKRAGTPLQKESRKRVEPASEASLMSEAPMGTDATGGEPRPKPKTRARKTPKRPSAATSIPSSQITNIATGATSRKRGRPRKALIPEEAAVLAEARKEASYIDSNRPPSPELPTSDAMADLAQEEATSARMEHDDLDMMDGQTPEDDHGTPAPAHDTQEPETARQHSQSPSISEQEAYSDYGYAGGMDEDYPPMAETHSDSGSEAAGTGGGDTRHDGQDTLAHASDFSMIAIESLPSFQASVSALASEHYEMGEATSLIINQTLDSLRQSTQTEAEQQPPSRSEVESPQAEQSTAGEPPYSLDEVGGNSQRAMSRSPRRPKPLPLNRQLFTRVQHADDSFSSIPDSILQSATPGRLPMKPTSSADISDASGMYEDSFSEVPGAILEAATPKPPGRLGHSGGETAVGSPALSGRSNSVDRSGGSQFGSNRLPTPDDTSSSTAGSKRAHEDETTADPTSTSVAGSNSRQRMPSSPPVMPRPRSIDFGRAAPQRNFSVTPERQASSPPLPPSAKPLSEHEKSLEAPVSNRRPTLSPIVRVGRTLQSVLTDRSSPEDRESSLGSPFRGSVGSDHPRSGNPDTSRHSSIARSPTHTYHNINQMPGAQSMFEPSSPVREPLHSKRHRRQSSEGLFGSAVFSGDGYLGNSSRGIPARNDDRAPMESREQANHSRTSSVKAAVPSEDSMSWVADGAEDGQIAQQEQAHSRSSSIDATFGSNVSDRMIHDHENGDEELEDAQDQELDGEEGDMEDLLDGEEEDADIWDIEASRPSPAKADPLRVTPLTKAPPSRRNKIPSPWRRPTRRLIYQDEIASSSHIAIEEASQSDADEFSLVPPSQRPSRQSTAQQNGEDPPPRPSGVEAKSSASQRPSSEPPMPKEHSEERLDESSKDPAEDYSEEQPELMDSVENDQYGSVLPEPPSPESQQSLLHDKSTGRAEASEYSMVAEHAKAAPTPQEKPTSAKSRFFGGFDIRSFFSSPATLPPRDVPTAKQQDTNTKTQTIAQPSLSQPAPKESQGSLWSTGLFPSIPQKDFRSSPSPERRASLFSPGYALQSNDTVADTYAPSPSVSPERSPALSASLSPEPSVAQTPSAGPSTPERQVFPPIEQKQNFTPRPGQSGSSLLGSSRAESLAEESEPDDGFRQVQNEEQESSLLTDSSEYERVPPREKPSQWDKTLSPSKSCFRSPLKPTTPGRVVAFTSSALSPLAQMQACADNQAGNANSGTTSQEPLFHPLSNGKETHQPSSLLESTNRPLGNDAGDKADIPTSSTMASGNAAASAGQSRQTTRNSHAAAFALSQTSWSKQHWVRLDEMLQLRRRDPLRFQQTCALPPKSQRRSDYILGKEVTAQGESIIIEPWHLEVVEAFRHEVGSWDERNLAKRLFALLIGEERRKAHARRATAAAELAAQ
ncbi:hypothetical protein F4778DRAFT_719475 [Xylariomycetidae sp. FL2044]|nr:hypothetical protein F4778DRAFT_719475 [Xylariomycetidae sp. FL2044]